MVFAVSPPWGPWSDNIVPLVRPSRCLIRTANGASPTFPRVHHPPASGSPLSGLQCLTRKLEKEMKNLDSVGAFLPRPRESGIRVQERLMGEGAPSPAPAQGTRARVRSGPARGALPAALQGLHSACWPLPHRQVPWELPQADRPEGLGLLWLRLGGHRLDGANPAHSAQAQSLPPPHLCSQWLSFMLHTRHLCRCGLLWAGPASVPGSQVPSQTR